MPAVHETALKKLEKIMPLLSSDKDGEVVAAARAIQRILKESKLDWHDLTAVLISEIESVNVPPRRHGPKPEPRSMPIVMCEIEGWSIASDSILEWCDDISSRRISASAQDFIYKMRDKGNTYARVIMTDRQFNWFASLLEAASGMNIHPGPL